MWLCNGMPFDQSESGPADPLISGGVIVLAPFGGHGLAVVSPGGHPVYGGYGTKCWADHPGK